MQNQKFLITGATGQIAGDIARHLAPDNTVHAIARFSAAGSREMLEQSGVKCIKLDFASDDLAQLDKDYDYVMHLATTQVPKDTNFDRAIEINAVATGRLMARFPGVKAFFFSSTCAVYAPNGHTPLQESDPLGDAMRAYTPTYSISKIAAEAVVKFASEQFKIPSIIARMNVAYGRSGGLPVMHLESLRRGEPIFLHPDKPNCFSPIVDEDYVRQALEMLAIASTPAQVINWCGSQVVSAEEWCEYMAGLLGVEANFVYTDKVFPCTPCDPTLMHEKIGPTQVDWREAMKKLVAGSATEARHTR